MAPMQSVGDKVEALVPAAIGKWGINRCDGTREEFIEYCQGSGKRGWAVKGQPSKGDLLVGTVGHGVDRLIINVNRVEGIGRRTFEWKPSSDVPIHPPVGWSEVARRAGRAVTPWQRLDGEAAKHFLEALIKEVADPSDVPEPEGRQRLTRCRVRSSKNRLRKLETACGVCEACGVDFRLGFGIRGDRALDVHHLKPLSESKGEVKTGLADLAVLCGSCHKLVHADPRMSIAVVRLGWTRMWAKPQ